MRSIKIHHIGKDLYQKLVEYARAQNMSIEDAAKYLLEKKYKK
jgi:hypothetical protein